MYASLTGVVERCGDGSVVVDVNGVGYLVRCPESVAVEACGKSTRLIIETVVREDSITLYGFLSDLQREWFRALIGVQGIGPRTAVAVLSVLSPGELARAVLDGDSKEIARADGVGPKSATRIAADLRERAEKLIDRTLHEEDDAGVSVRTASASLARQALLGLGYSADVASSVIAAAVIELGRDMSPDKLVKAALVRLQ